ncbi:MAG: hypothetical protein GC152_02210 [Alphaproteobacteria bacterium]|nr:hypothetical protein [Alphaproteobacteria bacterium]
MLKSGPTAGVIAGVAASIALFAPCAAFADEAGFSFPPEWAPHEAVWMGWPDEVAERGDFKALWAEIITALTPHVRVKLVVNTEAAAAAARRELALLGVDVGRIEFIVQPTSDIWLRDSGPLFISDGQELRIADFEWGYYGFPWPYGGPAGLARGALDREAATGMGLERRRSELIAEGGGLDVNSNVMVAYLDAAQHRNPGATVEEIEAEYLRLYGKKKIVWLDRAPISDRVFAGPKVANFFGWGANGHVDEYVRFVDEKTILVAQVAADERDANALYRLDDEILRENRAQLEAARDIDGAPFRVVPVPMPDIRALMGQRTLTEKDFQRSADGMDTRSVFRDFKVGDEIVWVPAASYLNFLVTNGVVLVAKYWREGLPQTLKETDEEMRSVLAAQYPDREVVQINPLAVNWLGGGMHCITQQEPRLAAPSAP